MRTAAWVIVAAVAAALLFPAALGMVVGLVNTVAAALTALVTVPLRLLAGAGHAAGHTSLAIGPVLIGLLVLLLVIWAVRRMFAGTRAETPAADAELMRELSDGLQSMERRIDALETILMDEVKRGRR
jgi:phage shock protein B